MPRGSINGVAYDVPDGYVVVSAAANRRACAAANLLSDLDRSAAGRHQGDAESQDPTGYSQGNPLLAPGTHVGFTMYGQRIIVPETPGDPAAWIEASAS